MQPYKILKQELTRLLIFYKSCSFALQQLEKSSETTSKEFQNLQNQISELQRANKLENEISGSYQYVLRELIHIRIISALEGYLIDNIKQLLVNNKDLLKNATKIDFTYQELLSFENTTKITEKLIKKECRKLSSGGFIKIVEFYKRVIGIDIKGIDPGMSILEEYHDRRHLLIHRLGKTDSIYRKKYNTVKKGVNITRAYLEKEFIDIDKLTKTINELSSKKIKKVKIQPFNPDLDGSIKFKFISNINEEPDFINLNYEFWRNDNLICLKDILTEKTKVDDAYEIVLNGDFENIYYYYKQVSNVLNLEFTNFEILKIVKPAKQLASQQTKKIRTIKLPSKTNIEITTDTIESIKELLPQQPWPVGIHAVIAEKLKLRNAVVRNVIRYLISSKKIK